jgi:hypothetical protein
VVLENAGTKGRYANRCFSSRLYLFVAVVGAMASEAQGAGTGRVGYGSY